MESRVKCMECGKEYEVPCYEALHHEHNRWELIGDEMVVRIVDPERTIIIAVCKKCGFKWNRNAHHPPVVCARCKSYDWNK